MTINNKKVYNEYQDIRTMFGLPQGNTVIIQNTGSVFLSLIMSETMPVEDDLGFALEPLKFLSIHKQAWIATKKEESVGLVFVQEFAPIPEAPKDGINGKDGKDGLNGSKGDTGAAGKDGSKGDKGDKGDTGAAGKDTVIPTKVSKTSSKTSKTSKSKVSQ